ncbi:MAG: PIN domain-containing protein, partial [Balneolaceae bacterium]
MTFLDINFCLDLLVKQSPWHKIADQIAEFHIYYNLEMGVNIISIPTIAYLIDRHHKEYDSKEVLKQLATFVHILNADSTHALQAIHGDWKDLEDAMQFHCALSHNAQTIITRNAKDFRLSSIPVFHPEEWA